MTQQFGTTPARPGWRAMALAAAMLGAGWGGSAAAQEFTFTLHHFLGPQAPAHTQMLVPWAERVAEASAGRVAIEVFPAMTLGGRPPELVTQARDGVVDLIWTVNGYTPGLFPRSEVMELPNVFEGDARAANLAMFDMFDAYLAEDYRGLEVMFLHTHGGQALHLRDRPVHRPGDLAGMSLRTPSRTGAWSIEALGATPVAMPVPELPVALQRGTVDGALIPFEIIPALQLQDQTAYQVEGSGGYRIGTAVFQVSMNQARWDALPADIQAAFRAASDRDWWGEVGAIWNGTEEGGLAVATGAGNSHVMWSEAETAAFRAALEPVVERWVAEATGSGIDGAALVARARALVAAHSGTE
jgi:TRAP-type C4-dicarboxylate transport system substrate-binding protein